ncbi:850_t:CDS:2 [Funneliformis mosseae]|uniref:850_t:CDS:1 n=1 Tax=Funneliformis mosseae TaxID=27381 RepID=A0A9N9N3A2_FUNMO|nr:850_t:CDS:2 [Funneliformis mosseae]
MTNHISNTVNNTANKAHFSAPVVQSRLEHHHLQQLKHPEARHQSHNRSKSLNRGKRGFSYNHQQQLKETSSVSSSSTATTSPATDINSFPRHSNNKNFSNYSNNRVDNFDSYNREPKNVDGLVENGSVGQLQRKSSTSSRPLRRHQYSDSVDEDKFRVTPSVSILKRPQSATDFVKPSKASISLDVTHEQRYGKAKRAQRRKEIKSMTEVLEYIETDFLHSASPPQPITIKQFSGSGDESDVNSTSNAAFLFPPLNYSNAIIALEEGMNSNKRENVFSNSDDNVTIRSPSDRPVDKEYKRLSDNHVDSAPRRRLSSTAIELQSQVSRFSDSDSVTPPSESILSSTPPTARRLSSSPGRLGGAHKLYAGPTFHNSPAPSDLPMPSFYSKSLGKDPSPLSVGGNNLFTVPENMPSPPKVYNDSNSSHSSPSSGNASDDDIFAMDDFEPSSAPYYPETPTLRKQKSQELLRILAAANARQHQTAAAYMVPERMATAHHPMKVYPANNGLNLNEISETLRNMLKIHGQ